MNSKLFYQFYNAIHNPKSYKGYIGKKYQYGNNIITIVDIYNDDYFKTTSTSNNICLYYNIYAFLEDVKNNVYKEIK